VKPVIPRVQTIAVSIKNTSSRGLKDETDIYGGKFFNRINRKHLIKRIETRVGIS
jgi:hypothetical protein